MSEQFTGQCACGKITYQCEGEPASVMMCHCRDCQYASGSAFSTVAFFPSDNCDIKGETKAWSVKGSAGMTVNRHFCDNCGTPMYSTLVELPDLVFLKVGTLDDPNALSPAAHMWCQSKLNWLKLDDGLDQLPGNPALG